MPRFSELPRQRWLYFPALLISLIAYRLTISDTAVQRPASALITWFIAIALAIYALRQTNTTPPSSDNDPPLETSQSSIVNRQSSIIWLFIPIVLFIVAYIIRVIDLSNHPFILNGTEANIGLDALRLAQGMGTRNPFSTSWLTNPTLSIYLLSIPLKLFGPSTFAIRALSPIAGALTVVAVYC